MLIVAIRQTLAKATESATSAVKEQIRQVEQLQFEGVVMIRELEKERDQLKAALKEQESRVQTLLKAETELQQLRTQLEVLRNERASLRAEVKHHKSDGEQTATQIQELQTNSCSLSTDAF